MHAHKLTAAAFYARMAAECDPAFSSPYSPKAALSLVAQSSRDLTRFVRALRRWSSSSLVTCGRSATAEVGHRNMKRANAGRLGSVYEARRSPRLSYRVVTAATEEWLPG